MADVRVADRLRPAAVEGFDLGRGAVVALDGGALYLVAVLLAAYYPPVAAEDLPFTLNSALVGYLTRWTASPGIGPLEACAYVGVGLLAVGPGWYWFGRPLYRAATATDEPASSELVPVDDAELSVSLESVDDPFADSVSASDPSSDPVGTIGARPEDSGVASTEGDEVEEMIPSDVQGVGESVRRGEPHDEATSENDDDVVDVERHADADAQLASSFTRPDTDGGNFRGIDELADVGDEADFRALAESLRDDDGEQFSEEVTEYSLDPDELEWEELLDLVDES